MAKIDPREIMKRADKADSRKDHAWAKQNDASV